MLDAAASEPEKQAAVMLSNAAPAATPWLDTRAIYVAGLCRSENRAHFRNERTQIDEAICGRVHHDNRNAGSGDVLLELQILIDCDERIETVGAHTGEQESILATLPPEIRDVHDVEPMELALKRSGR